jgi:hypothetical protein
MAAATKSGATSLTKLGEASPAAAFEVEVGFEAPVVLAAPLETAVGEGPLPEPAVADTLESKSVDDYMMVKNVPTYLEDRVAVPVADPVADPVALADELPDLVAVEDTEVELDEEEKAANMSEFPSTIATKSRTNSNSSGR